MIMTKVGDDQGKTTNLEQKRQVRKYRSTEEKKPSQTELFRSLARAMEKSKFSRLPEFPFNFHVVGEEDGQSTIIESDDSGLCRKIHRDRVVSAILSYCNNELGEFPYYPDFDVDKVKKVFAYWASSAAQIAMPKAVRWNDEHGLCFSKLPWNLADVDAGFGNTDLFDEMLSRCTNAEALAAWIGSIFVENSDLQTYVWIYGDGCNGKGALARFLYRTLGRGYASLQVPQNNDKHWTAQLIGKRLGVFPDCNNYGFVKSGLFKSLTGGDPVTVEEKYYGAMTMKLPVKFMFNSNEQPKITSQLSDLRRIIFCEIKPIPGSQDPFYEEKLWAEGGHFIMQCIELYKSLCPNHEVIPVDESLARDLAEENEMEYQTIFDKLFIVQDGSHVIAEDYQNALRQEFYTRDERTKFTTWVTKVKKYARYDRTGGRKYKGIRVARAF